MREMWTRYPSELLGEVEKLSCKTYGRLTGKLRKSIRRVERKIAETEDGRKKSIFIHYRKSLEYLKDAVRVRRLYFLRYGGKEPLPLPEREEEVEKFVREVDRKEVWERIRTLQEERERAKGRMELYRKKSQKKRWLRFRYLYLLHRRALSLLYLYILKEGKV